MKQDNVSFQKISYVAAFIEKSLTAQDILGCDNTEKKAVLIKEYGYDAIIKEANAKIIDTYHCKSKVTDKMCTYQVLEFKLSDTLNARVISVEDHSTHKKTFLGVPINDQTKTCLGAIAWTFGETEESYTPIIET